MDPSPPMNTITENLASQHAHKSLITKREINSYMANDLDILNSHVSFGPDPSK